MTRPLLRRRVATLALACLSSLNLACKDDPAPADSEDPPAAPADGGKDSREQDEAAAPTAQPAALSEAAPSTTDSAAIADHGQVVATVQLPTGDQLADLTPIAEKLAPGTSALIRMQVPSMLGQILGMKLDGANLSSPMSLLAVDPSFGGDKPVALLVEVEDQQELQDKAQAAGLELKVQGKLGLLGSAPVVAAVESYAFEHLTRYPDHTELVIYPASIAATLGPQINEFVAAMEAGMAAQGGGPDGPGKEMMRMYAEAFVSAIGQTERAVISVGQGQSSVDLHLHLYPIAETTLASFIDAQVPADHSLLAKLPASVPQTMLMSGEMRAGAAKAALLEFSIESVGEMYSDKAAWLKMVEDWLATVDGELAMAINFNFAPEPGQTPGMNMQGLFGTSDSAAMFTAWRTMLEAMTALPMADTGAEMMGMKVELAYDKDALSHDGVTVDRYSTKIDLDSLPADQRAAMERMGSSEQNMDLAAFDSYGALVSAGDEGEAMKAMIDAARGKGPALQPSAGLAASLAASEARQESVLVFFDLAAIAPPEAKDKIPFTTVTIAIGKYDGALSLRVSGS